MNRALQVFVATLFGVVVSGVQKLGPTVIIFVYLYFVEHANTQTAQVLGVNVQVSHLLIVAITIISVLMIVFKSIVVATSRRLDSNCILFFDGIVLRKIHKWDLSLGTIRAKSLGIHAIMKSVMLFVILAAIAAINSFVFPAIICTVLIVSSLLAYGYPAPAIFQSLPHVKQIFAPENYSELMLIIGLLIGFVLTLQNQTSTLGSVIVLMLVARFSGQLRILTKTLSKLSLWKKEAKLKRATPGADRYRPKVKR